ncbi:MAG: hypothetical protein ABIR46_03920 [Candidatus Saccharimonadales bacterium]
MKPRLFVEQKITAFTNIYKVFQTADSGDQGQLSALAQQKRLAFKEKITFYSDETKSAEVWTFRAEKILDVHGRYFVEDQNGQVIGMFKKEFKQSFITSTWTLMDVEGKDLFTVRESSTALAFFRRYACWVPVVGEIIEIVTSFLRYHFVFTKVGSEEVVGKYQKTTLFRDHYTLSLTDDAYEACDWRVLASFSVALDALQSR